MFCCFYEVSERSKADKYKNNQNSGDTVEVAKFLKSFFRGTTVVTIFMKFISNKQLISRYSTTQIICLIFNRALWNIAVNVKFLKNLNIDIF